MHLSFWEDKTWFSNIDFAVIGSGIVGINCALALRKKHPKSKIVVFERGVIPSGASTKNAGFACFGSISEILDDLQKLSEKEVFELVDKRMMGLKVLRETLGDKVLAYEQNGGYEVFLKQDKPLYELCLSKIEAINRLLKPIFKEEPFKETKNPFELKGVYDQLIYSKFEGQLDPGKMMLALIKKAIEMKITILNSCEVTEICDFGQNVSMQIDPFGDVLAKKVFIATNGFASQFLSEDIKPARAQVLITNPIKDLQIKGIFHLDQGYYYFRNVGNRILLGGGRHLDLEGEETTEMDLTVGIQDKLDTLLEQVILPHQVFQVERRWSGIMGLGLSKRPIIKAVSENVFCGIRLGGMGVAIGSLVGNELSRLLD